METISSNLSRRTLLRSAVTAATAAVVVGPALRTHASAQDEEVAAAASGFYRTTSYVNFRTGPGTDYGVIRVLPPESPLQAVGPASYGFMKVSNQGTIGWVHADFVATGNGGSSDTPQSLGAKTTSAYVNMRSGPGTGYSVIRTLPQGTAVEVFDNFQGNFQLVGYAQQLGWVSLDYLSGGGGNGDGNGGPIGQLRVTSALNLRSSASMSARVITVMPAGAMVWPGSQVSQGFRYVELVDGSAAGWAYDAYLA
ncbi:MAG: SH3 domain-containing protein [Thermomicrobiales bacterium]|nr:MAG: SH3 domain-containing protein [Thermomicrobiales bacterium]